MPDHKENAHFESGRATAPPSVCLSSILSSASEEYTHSTATAPGISSEQNTEEIFHSPAYTPNFNNFAHQRTQSTSGYISDYSLCHNSHSIFLSTKTDTTNYPFQSPHYPTDYFTSSHIRSSPFSSANNSSSYTNSDDSSNLNNTGFNANSNNGNFEFMPFSKVSLRNQESFIAAEEALSSEQLLSTLNYSKISKSSLVSTQKQAQTLSNISFTHSSQAKCNQNKETVDLGLEKNSKSKKNLEGTQKLLKTLKDNNFQESYKNGMKIKNEQETNTELVTDSFIHLLQKKNSQDNLSSDLGDISPILVSLTNKYKSDVSLSLKKKESNEDLKLMNDFLTKIILEKEEKRLKTLDDKKKFLNKETFNDLNSELDERKTKRDAMSHYQEDKNHKRSSNYGDYNQWEYFGQQDIQSSNSHNRRGHFSFGNTSQQHSVSWNQMGVGMPRQTNPYYANPHSHMMPAHAHSDYRYNQWNNPNHKNLPNVHSAHSQSTVLPQAKVDIKHHADISSSVQDFGLPIGSTPDFSKFRSTSKDLLRRTPPGFSEKSRTGIRTDHLTSISPGIRNSTIRTPVSSHPKTMINNPLSDLQMLVTNQESENPPQKTENFQQESVDLSAHSEVSKQKENLKDESLSVNNTDVKDFRTSVSVIQIQNKHVKSDFNDSEKPVELTSKNSERNARFEISPSIAGNIMDNKTFGSGQILENVKEIVQNEVMKVSKEHVKTSVIVGKDGDPFFGTLKNDLENPKSIQNGEHKLEKKNLVEKGEAENEKKEKATFDEYSHKTEAAQVLDEKNELRKCEEINEKVSEKILNDPNEKCNDAESTKNFKRKTENEEFSSEKKKGLVEFESQLQKMFDNSGEESADLPTVTSTSADVKPVVNEILKKTPKKKPSRKSRIGRLSSGQSSGSERSLLCKKFKSSVNKEDSRKKMKKSLCDVMDRRGPFLHVMGSRESPASVIVVNFPKGDDEDEKDKSCMKKQILNTGRTKHHNELDYRGKSRNGLYSSTLSTRYDAHTTDYTWICVFCKKGPHYSTMGDLFGPYIISKDDGFSVCDFSGDEKDISDAQKRGGRNKKSLRSNNMVEHFQKMSKKLRRAQSTESCLTGMTVISNDQVDQLRYEIWVHEQCAVWSPNVFLIGTRIIGMQEAIWCSVKTMCSKCGITGANIGCVYRNCPNRSHYHCAKECGWSLEQETFISTCHIHKPRS